jgi:metal-sulfur cluster biosynthetic enzyme
MTEDDVTEALRQVVDPEVGVNIVDLGLVQMMDARPDRVYVGLIMTTPACPQSGSICQEATDAIRSKGGDVMVDVELLTSPFWTPDRMSADAKKQLGWPG